MNNPVERGINLFGPTDENPEPKKRPGGLLHGLFGSTDDIPSGSGGVTRSGKLIDSLLGPTDENNPGGDNFLERLLGSPDGRRNNGAATTSPSGSEKGSGAFDVIGAAVTVVRAETQKFRKAQGASKLVALPPPTPQPKRYEVLERNMRQMRELQAQSRTTASLDPKVAELRSQVMAKREQDRIQEAQKLLGYMLAENRRVDAIRQRQKDTTAFRARLQEQPLTTSGWNGYAKWRDSMNQPLKPIDASIGLPRYLAKALFRRGVHYVNRWFDAQLAMRPAKVTVKDGKTVIEIDEHTDDQIIFDGKRLMIVNPTTSADVITYQAEQVNARLVFAMEGSRLFQGLTRARAEAGEVEPVFLAGRGVFVIRTADRGNELARVPMFDPAGFRQALQETISMSLAPTDKVQIQGYPYPSYVTIRDLLEFPEDSPDAPSKVVIRSDAGDSNAWANEQLKRIEKRRESATDQPAIADVVHDPDKPVTYGELRDLLRDILSSQRNTPTGSSEPTDE